MLEYLLLIKCQDCRKAICKGEDYWSIDGNYYHVKCVPIDMKDSWVNNDKELITVEDFVDHMDIYLGQ